MRIFSVPDGDIVAEIDAHAGWITGMDLASQTGRLVTTAEDGIVRVSNILLAEFKYKITKVIVRELFGAKYFSIQFRYGNFLAKVISSIIDFQKLFQIPY